MSLTNRRTFMLQVVAGGSALAASQVMAQAAPMVAETDANAVSLGYKADATKVDAKKFPAHKPTQMCGNCALFQGKATDAAGNCPLFAGKQVAAKGWCSAYAPKAA
ncbi:MAG: high-potential iron-sulfur protein [Pseudomonadota bacterium]|nr:high-potential iron-sulfur protein [Pseudomonadota bacterium]